MSKFKSRALSSLLLTAVLLTTLISVSAQKGTSIVRRVQFPRGRTTTVLKGSVRRGVSNDYLLRASSGQTMTVHLAATGGVSFSILSPSGDSLADFSKDWSGELPGSGDYRINVLPDTTTSAPHAYALEVTVR